MSTNLPSNPSPWSKPQPTWEAPLPPRTIEVMEVSFKEPPAPRPLREDRAPSQPFPVDALSYTLNHTVNAIEDLIQCPTALAAMSVLSAASLAVQGHANVLIPATNQARPLSLFLLSIAESGERKSSADSEALKPVKEYEQQLDIIYSADAATYENQFKLWEVDHRRIANDSKLSRDDRERQLRTLVKPLTPLLPIITCPEPTIEGLYKLFLNGHASLGLFSSEGGVFVGGHGMNDDARLRTGSSLSDLWDGNPVKRVRAGKEETYTLNGRRLALHLMIQPTVAEKFLSFQDLQGQGLFSRMLIAQPESKIGTRFQKDKSPDTDPIINWYSRKVLSIFQTQLPLTTGKRNEVTPRCLHFDGAAIARWNEYADEIEQQQATGYRFEAIRGFAGKLLENASRIAGVMTLIEDLAAPFITLEMLNKAITIVDYFADEALRVFTDANNSAEMSNAEKLHEWLKHSYEDFAINLREIQRRGPACMRNLKDAVAAVETLVDYGWLIPAPKGTVVNDHACVKDVWLIV